MQRRGFISGAAGALAVGALHGYAEEFTGTKKRVGLVGTGWYGKCDLFRLLQVAPVEVVSLCDVDSVLLKEAGALVAGKQVSKKTPRLYGDYREMLKEKDLDIVLVDTPDHWHALQAIAAMQAGADVYCQKPISADVVEGQAMLAAARKYKRVVQIGMQRRSTPHLIKARDEVIRCGKLGKIGMVDIYCYYHMRSGKNPVEVPVPSHLNYDMWSGPAPLLPYHELRHPRTWRLFKEYGNGIVGDMCVHMLDTVRWMLGLGWPRRVASTGGILVDTAAAANIADTQSAFFEFPEFPVVWTHRTYGEMPDPKYPWGITIHGEKGTLKCSLHQWDFIPKGGKGAALHGDVVMELDRYPEDATEPNLEKHVAPAIRQHMGDFLRCIDSRGRPVSDIEEGFISSTSCILANLAMETGRALSYDVGSGTIPGDEVATRLMKRAYRSPWVHPDPSTI